MKKYINLVFFFITILVVQNNGLAAIINNRLYAVVGDDVITEFDIKASANLIVMMNRTQKPVLTEDLKRTIANNLIDEKLIMIQGKKLRITIPEVELEAGSEFFLKRAGLTKSSIESAIKKGLIDKNTFRDFVMSQMMSQKIIKEKISRELQYSRAEKISFKPKAIEIANKERNKFEITVIEMNQANALTDVLYFDSKPALNKKIESSGFVVQSRDVLSQRDIRPELLNIIRMSNSSHGLIPTQYGIIAFSEIKDSNQAINDLVLNELYEKQVFVDTVKRNMDNLRKNTYIKFFTPC
jgi:hypothetical protein